MRSAHKRDFIPLKGKGSDPSAKEANKYNAMDDIGNMAIPIIEIILYSNRCII